MGAVSADKERRLIPRWRSSDSQIAGGELTSVKKPTSKTEIDRDTLEEKLQEWNLNHTIEVAGDLVASALVLGEIESVREAAETLLGSGREVSDTLKRIARLSIRQIGTDTVEAEVPVSGTGSGNSSLASIRRIAALKAKLIESPRNPLAWSDLALAYSIIGQEKPALKAMHRAIALAPNSRFILRSASRLLVHLDRADDAHEILIRSPNTSRDPWLMAAEISTALIAKRAPQNVKRGKRIIKAENIAPIHLTELAGALGTEALLESGRKTARKLFEVSLKDPNENALAQAQWAVGRHVPINITEGLLEIPNNFEALALRARAGTQWDDVIAQCRKWGSYEPFSTRPYIFASYIASTASGDYTAGSEIANEGLVANPTDSVLLNNLAVNLALQNNVAEAREVFSRIDRSSNVDDLEVALYATDGLLQFREGNIEEGRELYARAKQEADRTNDPIQQIMVLAHWAREESNANSEFAEELLNVVDAKVDDHDLLEIRELVNGLRE